MRTLPDALAEAFRHLARGVTDRRHPFHTPTLATIGTDGAPRARTLVLRGFDAAARTLRLHTDLRSGKAAELAADPRCALHLYDAAGGVQIRLAGRATLHRDDAVADAAWAGSRVMSRAVYAVEPGPGTPIAAPLPAPSDAGAGRTRFAVITVRFDSLDWLELAATGHRRARFDWTTGAPEATWLVP
ncbi:pyridoxamine 5'-phosphate oxidase family protein [Falsiroseomonas sp. CW058]|uniref:pyridoxamine 5'-phosphate oxidase family protein n=1 Tax=Falsiroseomonas sp. CW058 TaxID=3388664 RepID=UPI003D31EC9F